LVRVPVLLRGLAGFQALCALKHMKNIVHVGGLDSLQGTERFGICFSCGNVMIEFGFAKLL
jgi:hypothetical protein